MGVAVAFLMVYSRVRLRLELLDYFFVMDPAIRQVDKIAIPSFSLQCYGALGGRCEPVFSQVQQMRKEPPPECWPFEASVKDRNCGPGG